MSRDIFAFSYRKQEVGETIMLLVFASFLANGSLYIALAFFLVLVVV